MGLRLKFILMATVALLPLSQLGQYAFAISAEQRALYYSGINWFDINSPLDCGPENGEVLNPGKVYIIGDSLTVRAEDQLRERFVAPWDVGIKDASSDLINGSVGRRAEEAVDILNDDYEKVASANAVVVALGTNNGGSNISDSIKDIIVSVRSKNPSAHIFWVDAASSTPAVHDFTPVNESIYNNSASLGYQVISWFQAVFPGEDPTVSYETLTDTKNYLTSDGVHQSTPSTTPAGQGTAAFATLIFDNVSRSVTSSKSSGTSAVAVGSSNVEIVYNFFRSKGFTPEQAAGATGNLMSESGANIDPTVTNVSSGAFGIAQWLGARKTNLQNFAAGTNSEIASLETQLKYLWFELSGEPQVSGADGKRENKTYREMIKQTSVEDAAATWADEYERSGDTTHIKRIAFAQEVYESYKDNPATGGVFAASAGCQTTGEFVDINIIAGNTDNIPCEGSFLSEELADGWSGGQLYKIRVCTIELPDGGSGPKVNSQISGAVTAMIYDAAKAGIDVSGGSFRTMAGQIGARIRNCSSISDENDPDLYDKNATCETPTAVPGYSNHQMGLAIDMRNIHTSECVKVVRDGHDKYCTAPANPVWVWLDSYAGLYGLKQLHSESWHWSVNGG